MRAVFLPVVLFFALTWQARAAGHPNVIVILADDQGWGDLSINGNTNLATPNIDSLGRAGALLEHFYVCPVCSPTRAEFLTGRYHPRGGVHDVSTGGERLNLDERTIADTFSDAGYATGAFGKWHNGTQYPYHPNGRGFREFYGFTSGHWGDYFDAPLDHNGELVQGHGFLADDLTEHALEFIEQNKAKPFFCYLAYNTPHSPLQVPDRFYEKFAQAELPLRAANPAQEQLPFTRAVLAMCENLDWNVGRVLAQLERLQLAQETIVLYFSDNGPNSFRWNGGMKGKKGSTDEGGVRAPFVIRWPGHIPAATRVPQIAGAIDLLPTLAALAGIKVTSTKPLDGVNLRPLLLGEKAKWAERLLFSTWAGKVSVRSLQYRLDATGALFDLAADPGQQHDVAAQRPQEAARLRQAVEHWRAEVLAPNQEDHRPFTIDNYIATQLPARDGVPHGNIKRSTSAPNCSFFTNWTGVEDSITWDVEVFQPGRYEAIIYYTCPPAEIGSTIELSLNGARVAATVAPANDPPLRGMEHDRVPREGESFVKDFQPLRLGEIKLSAGRGELTLRALKLAHQQVMDVRAVSLKSLEEHGRPLGTVHTEAEVKQFEADLADPAKQLGALVQLWDYAAFRNGMSMGSSVVMFNEDEAVTKRKERAGELAKTYANDPAIVQRLLEAADPNQQRWGLRCWQSNAYQASSADQTNPYALPLAPLKEGEKVWYAMTPRLRELALKGTDLDVRANAVKTLQMPHAGSGAFLAEMLPTEKSIYIICDLVGPAYMAKGADNRKRIDALNAHVLRLLSDPDASIRAETLTKISSEWYSAEMYWVHYNQEVVKRVEELQRSPSAAEQQTASFARNGLRKLADHFATREEHPDWTWVSGGWLDQNAKSVAEEN